MRGLFGGKPVNFLTGLSSICQPACATLGNSGAENTFHRRDKHHEKNAATPVNCNDFQHCVPWSDHFASYTFNGWRHCRLRRRLRCRGVRLGADRLHTPSRKAAGGSRGRQSGHRAVGCKPCAGSRRQADACGKNRHDPAHGSLFRNQGLPNCLA